MKNRFAGIILFILLGSIPCVGCFKQSGSTATSAGQKQTFTAEGVSFSMVYVPAGSFFIGTGDEGASTVTAGFRIGETEVTYELWEKVTTWATKHGGYKFANPGIIGSSGQGSVRQPVTIVNWRDSLIFGNAITEWLNTKSGSGFTCVYKANNAPIRDARGNNGEQCDTATQDLSATGFRLPTNDEWELAARYKADLNNDGDIRDANEYYPGNFASGAAAPYTDAKATEAVAVYFSVGTNAVKSKAANALGIFDMSGNVDEWCFGWYPGFEGSARLSRGGNWLIPAEMIQLGLLVRHDPYTENFLIGFRLAKNR